MRPHKTDILLSRDDVSLLLEKLASDSEPVALGPAEIKTRGEVASYLRQASDKMKSASPGSDSASLALSSMPANLRKVLFKRASLHFCSELYFELQRNSPESLVNMVDLGLDVNAVNGNGETLLFSAVSAKNYDLARQLLDRGADPNATAVPVDGSLLLRVPLHLAASDPRMMKLLLDAGADATIRTRVSNLYQGNFNNSTTLHLACRDNAAACVMLLVQAGADIDAEDQNGKKAMQIAQARRADNAMAALQSVMANRSIADSLLASSNPKPL